jgi:hypothetical protein
MCLNDNIINFNLIIITTLYSKIKLFKRLLNQINIFQKKIRK